MLQSPWSGLQPRTFDPTPLPIMTNTGLEGSANAMTLLPSTAPSDGVSRQWWGFPNGNSTLPTGGLGGLPGANGGILSLVQSLMGMLQQLITALMSGGSSTAGSTSGSGFGPEQSFQNVDISSTGDPHIAETGTAWGPNGPTAVDKHYDSMSGHRDLVDSHDVAGGYRVSTSVTQPDSHGVTYNQSATVHTDGNADQITMNKDGSSTITDHGQSVALLNGQSVMLSGGEIVTANQDGSLTVSATNQRGGSMTTTMRSTGSGVDVSTHAQNIGLGGEVVNHRSP